MGLASALSTALTGLSAAETTMDVVGNNLANADTVGFKQSQADFATQFLQTMSLGSAPTDNSGGTNPRQTGLGTTVAEITPDFTQGTIQVSSSPTDLAIQGDGFFMVQGDTGEQLYSRNGIFQLNSQNQMVSTTGQRLLGYGVNSNFEVNTSALTPITIPLGSAAVAQATQNVYLEGQLSPTGDVATTAEQIQSAVLSDGHYTAPDQNGAASLSIAPNVAGANTNGQSQTTPGGAMTPGATYEYKLVYTNSPVDTTQQPLVIPPLSEGAISDTVTATVNSGDDSIQLQNIPDPTVQDPSTPYTYVRIYRRTQGSAGDYNFIADVQVGQSTYTDKTSDAAAAANPALNQTQLSGQYKYYVTFANQAGGPPNGIESRVALEVPPATLNVVNGRIMLTDLPKANPGDGWTVRRIYRSSATDQNDFHYIGEIPSATSDATITDNLSDAQIAGNPTLNMNGPAILPNTKLTDILRQGTSGFTQLFHEGTLEFTGQKGGTTLAQKTFTVDASTTAQDLANFMTQALGIQAVDSSQTASGGTVSPGGAIDNGAFVLTGNNGVVNAINIPLSGMTMSYLQNGATVNETVDMGWSQAQAAVGAGAATDTVVYDSLGIALPLHVTAVLESRNSTETTYRWFADCADNSYGSTPQIAVGTGTVTFDTSGNFKSASQNTVNIHRDGFPTVNPLTFQLDFSKVSGLATDTDSLAVTRQDGSAPGTLTSFTIGSDGVIKGAFTNGISRDLGQVRLARFANPAGLEQRGLNQYAAGANSGLPVQGNPGTQGIGTLVAGAVELSNTDVGGGLIDLILGSTMYQGNARVISTIQQMFDVLMTLGR